MPKSVRSVLSVATAFALPAIAWLAIAMAPVANAAGKAAPNDVARFLAGMPLPGGSALTKAARSPGAVRHAAEMTTAWEAFDKNLLGWIRAWSAKELPVPHPAMFYMFGGPDFVHADAFYPKAATYVLSGLEPVGTVPNIAKLNTAKLEAALATMRASLKNFIKYGYFITREMDAHFRAGAFKGTLPVLLVFLARTGKTVHDVAFVNLTAKGGVVPARRGSNARGVKITFSAADGNARTLYYFRTNLANAGVKKSGFLKFCARLGKGGALVKSASYLMHLGSFSRVRDFLLKSSAVIVQDDSGIPLKHFSPEAWKLRPFGRYLGPIDQFKKYRQPDLAELFARRDAKKVRFGIGYRWHHQRTNILVAEKLGTFSPQSPKDRRKRP